MPDHLLRRLVLVLVAATSLVAGALVIRIAGDYTAAAAPLIERPMTVEQITSEIDAERAAARVLQGRLAAIGTRVAGLRAAIEAVGDRAGTDAESAARLAAELDLADAKLAELQRALSTSGATTYQTVTVPAPAAAVSGGGGGHEEEDEHEEEHEAEDD